MIFTFIFVLIRINTKKYKSKMNGQQKMSFGKVFQSAIEYLLKILPNFNNEELLNQCGKSKINCLFLYLLQRLLQNFYLL